MNKSYFGSIVVTHTNGTTTVYREDDGFAFAYEIGGGGSLQILRRAKGDGEPKLYAAYAAGAWAAARYDDNAKAEVL